MDAMEYNFGTDTQSVGFLSQHYLESRQRSGYRGREGSAEPQAVPGTEPTIAAGLWQLLRENRIASRSASGCQHLDAAVQLD